MSIRMTKEMRTTIADAVYKATEIPGKLEKLERDIHTFFTTFAKNQVPKDFIKATAALPKNWLAQRTRISADGGTTFHSPNELEYSWQSNIFFNDPISVPNDFQFTDFKRSDLPKYPEHQKMLNEVVALDKQKKEIKKELMDTLNAYSTVEKLLKDFPEFAKHCPEKPVYALTVNPDKVVYNLKCAGFDITTLPAKPVITTPVKASKKPRAKAKV